jgi:CubicO group peptidase (beta-lactamase class C family)
MPLPQRPLGKTGVTVPVLGYGTAPTGKIHLIDAPLIRKSARLMNHAIDRGITYLDTSRDYGSQAKVGEVIARRRDAVSLATEVNKRKRDDVLKELRQNLKEMQTDRVDLDQVHAVNTMADLEAALAPGGAVAALEEARRQGLFSAPEDFAVLCQVLLSGGGWAGVRVLSPAAVRRMTTNRLDDLPDLPEPARRTQPWGLGRRLNHPGTRDRWGDLLGRHVFGHTGATGTMAWVDPQTRGS